MSNLQAVLHWDQIAQNLSIVTYRRKGSFNTYGQISHARFWKCNKLFFFTQKRGLIVTYQHSLSTTMLELHFAICFSLDFSGD